MMERIEAVRLIDDPAALARTARIFRAALARRPARLAREASTAGGPRSDAPSTGDGKPQQ